MRVFRCFPSIIIISFWLIMMALLVNREFFPNTIMQAGGTFPSELPFDIKWSVYNREEDIGYLHTKIYEEQSKYYLENKAEINIAGNIDTRVYNIVEFDNNKIMEEFSLQFEHDDISAVLDAKRVNDKLEFVFEKDGKKDVFEIKWRDEADLMSSVFIPWVYNPGLKVGDRYEQYVFNPITRNLESIKTIAERETIAYIGNDFRNVIVLNMIYNDIIIEVWVNNEGEPVKIITPWGWEFIAQ